MMTPATTSLRNPHDHQNIGRADLKCSMSIFKYMKQKQLLNEYRTDLPPPRIDTSDFLPLVDMLFNTLVESTKAGANGYISPKDICVCFGKAVVEAGRYFNLKDQSNLFT